jgi:SAM-dependent methyltransferase
MAYYDNVNNTLLDLVEPSARRVCEFGCGAGALARAIRARVQGVHYTGIELMPDQLAQAKDVLDVGIHRNLDRLTTWSDDIELEAALPPESCDHIIFGDVLEHLYDPERVLAQAVTRLAPGGRALVCIPNVQHWSVFVQLIRGNWPMADSGLFDRTHIRWFTLDDMVSLLQVAGLSVESIHPRIFDHEKGLSVMEDLEALALNLGMDPDILIQRGLPLQYVLVGRKASLSLLS